MTKRMRNRLIKSVSQWKCLAVLLLLAACSGSNTNYPILVRADSLMNSYPDSALHLLQSIENPQNMNEACRAKYALLLTQAWNKNWIPLTNDSLMQVAVEYYTDEKDENQAAKAYFYLGCVYDDLENMVEATNAFLQALMATPEKPADARLTSMIYEGLGRCYTYQGFYDKALEAYRAAYRISLERSSKKDALFSLDEMVNILAYQEQWDSAVYYSNQMIEFSRVMGDSAWVSSGFRQLADIYYGEEKYPEAYQAVTKSIREQHPQEKEHERDAIDNYMLLSDIFIGLGKYDSAHYYLSMCDTVSDITTRTLATLSLYNLEKGRGRYKEAVSYNDSFQILYDSITKKKGKEEIARLINNYTIEKYKRVIAEKQKQETRILIYLFIFVVVACVFVFLTIDRSRKRKYMNLQNSLMKKRREMLRVQEELMNLTGEGISSDELQSEQQYKRDTLKGIEKEKFEYSIQLFQTTPFYKKMQNLENKRSLEEKVFTAKERDTLCDCIYEIFADTMSDLKMHCPELTREDVLYCILYLLQHSNSVIIACTGTNANALKSRKSRLKHKMSEDLYAYVFGIDK